MFTGRRVDFLDGGKLTLQINRHRYCDYYTGRWLTQDPVGYVDTLNLYEYVLSCPLGYADPFGLEEGEVEFLSVGLYKGLGASLSVTMLRTRKDCCYQGDIIEGGDVTTKVWTRAHAGIGLGVEAKIGDLGVKAVWKSVGLTNERTFTFRNNKCGGGFLVRRLC
jgi:RHS repeat-associated protein